MSGVPIFFQGECLLLRWGESHKGRTVTLQLDPHVGEQHPFKTLKCGENGSRIMVVAVLVGDNEEPVPVAVSGPSQADPTPIKQGKRFNDLPRSQQAALKLSDPDFCDWLYELNADLSYITNDERLKQYLKIASKKELDTNPFKAAEWDKLRTDYDLRGYQL